MWSVVGVAEYRWEGRQLQCVAWIEEALPVREVPSVLIILMLNVNRPSVLPTAGFIIHWP